MLKWELVSQTNFFAGGGSIIFHSEKYYKNMLKRFLILFVTLLLHNKSFAGIHSAPIVISAQKVRTLQYHPLTMYRLFKTDANGNAIRIPFQIDEKDRYGDYILPKGPLPNQKFSNGIFDFEDEITIMGNDVGLAKIPTKWAFKKPSVLYEVKIEKGDIKGAVYIGTYFNDPPPLSPSRYVQYHVSNAEIMTSRYRYRFDRDNYLVVRGVDIVKKDQRVLPIINSSTLFLRADLRFFLTIDINHTNIQSNLEAYKDGPIRCIARVNFNYKILKLNFDLGMYTEVSFFSNSMELPAVIDNPLDGKKILNKGSQFYYGFEFFDSPKNMVIDTNMPMYKESGILDFLSGEQKAEKQYWFSAMAPDYMIYVEMEPSAQMVAENLIPSFYRENSSSLQLHTRNRDAQSLGKSPVNFATSLPLRGLSEGMHNIAIRLYVENKRDEKVIEEYKELRHWSISASRLPSSSYK